MSDSENPKNAPATPDPSAPSPTPTPSQEVNAKDRAQGKVQEAAQPSAKDTSGGKNSGQAQKAAAAKSGAAQTNTTGAKTAEKSTKKSATGKRPFPATATVALAVGLAVGVASYINYSRWQSTDSHTQALTNANSVLRNQLGELQQQINALQREDAEVNRGLERLNADLTLHSDTMKQLSQQFQALAADKGKDPMLWRSAEVEYLLAIANHRLILERDVTTALTALQDADRRLESIGDPALIPVRKLIASEVTALKSVDVPDIAGMALRLSSLVDNIEQLPLVSRERLKTDEATQDTQATVSNFRELLASIWATIKGMVSIRHSGQPIEPLLPPDEIHYLSQNLGLKLEEARIALLRRDTATFRQNLTDSRVWVERYFDPKAAAVNNVIAAVDELRDVELSPPLPDISDSLRDLRRWLSLQKQQQQRKGSAPAARVAKPSVEANVESSGEPSVDPNNPPPETPTDPTLIVPTPVDPIPVVPTPVPDSEPNI